MSRDCWWGTRSGSQVRATMPPPRGLRSPLRRKSSIAPTRATASTSRSLRRRTDGSYGRRTSARTRTPRASSAPVTAPPWPPVAPNTSTGDSEVALIRRLTYCRGWRPGACHLGDSDAGPNSAQSSTVSPPPGGRQPARRRSISVSSSANTSRWARGPHACKSRAKSSAALPIRSERPAAPC